VGASCATATREVLEMTISSFDRLNALDVMSLLEAWIEDQLSWGSVASEMRISTREEEGKLVFVTLVEIED
jgi:hypothetical protein